MKNKFAKTQKVKNKEKKLRQEPMTVTLPTSKTIRTRTQRRAAAKVQGQLERLKLKTTEELILIDEKKKLRKQKSELKKLQNQTPPRSEQSKQPTAAAKKKKLNRDKRLDRI